MTCHFIDHFTIEIFQISPKAASVSSYLTQIRQRSLTVEAPYTVQLVGALINLEIKVFMKVVNSLCRPGCNLYHKDTTYHFHCPPYLLLYKTEASIVFQIR